MKRYAILIGAEQYEEFDSTPFCHADVDSLSAVLTRSCDYAEQDVLAIKLTIDDSLPPNVILARINELLERSADGDTILFFFAGHGEVLDDDNSYLILPQTRRINKTTTALPLRDVVHYLSKNKRLNVRIFDTCHSGQDVRAILSTEDADRFTDDALRQAADGSITLASCSVHERSYCDDELQAGVFTHALVRSIQETVAGQSIQPEFLKIAICEKVAQWCLANNKQQTPTYTAHVHGNISIATRVQEVRASTTDIMIAEPRTLEERLKDVRSVAAIVTPADYPLLTQAIEGIRVELEASASRMDFFGTSVTFRAPESCDKAPYALFQPILSKLRTEISLHDIGSFLREADQTEYDVMLRRVPKKYTHYYLQQKSSQPRSYVEGTIQTDGYVPSCGVFAYMSPLQASVAIVYGAYFDLSFYGAEENIVTSRIERKTFSLKEIRESKHLVVCRPLIECFHAALRNKISERVGRLESEIGKLPCG